MYWTVSCYHPYLVSMLFADLLSLHLVTFLMLFVLVKYWTSKWRNLWAQVTTAKKTRAYSCIWDEPKWAPHKCDFIVPMRVCACLNQPLIEKFKSMIQICSAVSHSGSYFVCFASCVHSKMTRELAWITDNLCTSLVATTRTETTHGLTYSVITTKKTKGYSS